MEENKISGIKLVDSENIMMITTIETAKELLGEVIDEMVLVTRWIPYDGSEIGISFESKDKKHKKYQSAYKNLKPVIKDIDIKWSYSEEKIKSALKIMELLGWNHPEMYSPKREYPMLIRSGRRHSDKIKETIILIAPRIDTS